ncbi:hypothetical protein ABID16_000948 [Rhizobium aquaticum]|uniref:Uncharacterized protein n=1 Tax=Rhizobium aquaticum TaxID=1549636 RepID=A0ABV2IVY4_9HYPH
MMPYAEFTAGLSRQIRRPRAALPQTHVPNLLTIINNFNRTNKEHFRWEAIYSARMIKGNTLTVRGIMCAREGNELWIGFVGAGKASRQGLR